MSPKATLIRAFTVTLLVAASGCNRGPWNLKGTSGQRLCTIRRGMPRAAVLATCGNPTTGGVQRKTGDLSHRGLRMCSAEVDVYGCTFVLYNCDGLLKGVTQGWPSESVDIADHVDCT